MFCYKLLIFKRYSSDDFESSNEYRLKINAKGNIKPMIARIVGVTASQPDNWRDPNFLFTEIMVSSQRCQR